MKLISYYDLLGMIKEGNIPKKVYWVNIRKEKVVYRISYDYEQFSSYILKNINDEAQDIKFYLGDNFLESDMFKECIEIPNDDFEDIEEVTYKPRKIQNTINSLIKNQKKIIEMLKEDK